MLSRLGGDEDAIELRGCSNEVFALTGTIIEARLFFFGDVSLVVEVILYLVGLLVFRGDVPNVEVIDGVLFCSLGMAETSSEGVMADMIKRTLHWSQGCSPTSTLG